MALGGIYDTGTVTVSGAPALTVTGTGTLWSPVVEVGDWIWIAGQVGMIGAVNDNTHLTLEAPWQGTAPSGAPYVISKMSWLRYDPSLTQSKLRELLESLSAQGSFLFVEGAAPDPDMGEDGQWALKTDVSPWQLWFKVGGVWIPQATPAGLKWRGAWSSATTYAPADAVQVAGSSYVSKTSNTNKPPASNPADWDLMAQKGTDGTNGATGPTGPTGPVGMVWRGNWSASVNYAINDAVAMGDGSSYIAIAASGPGSGGAVAPPNAAKWNVLAQGGTTSIADSQIDPIKLNADDTAERLLFRNRLQFVSLVDTVAQSIIGDFAISKVSPAFYLDRADTNPASLVARRGGLIKWRTLLGDTVDNFALERFDNAGAQLFPNALDIDRLTGLGTVAGDPTAALGIVPRRFSEAYKTGNFLINGAFEVVQNLASGTFVSVPSGTLHICDGWMLQNSHPTAMSGRQIDGLNVGSPLYPTLNGALQVLSSAAISSFTGSQVIVLLQPIEGLRAMRLGFGSASGRSVTIGLFINSTVAGVIGVSLRNAATNRSCVQAVSLSAGYNFYSVTFPPDTTGTWPVSNATAMYLGICLGASPSGTLTTSTLGSWQAGNFVAPNTISQTIYNSAGNSVVVGAIAMVQGAMTLQQSMLQQLLPPFAVALAECSRYYNKTYDVPHAPGTVTTNGQIVNFTAAAFASRPFIQWEYPRMRMPPAVSGYSPNTGASGVIRNLNSSIDTAVTIYNTGERGTIIYPNGTPAVGDAFAGHFVSDARLT